MEKIHPTVPHSPVPRDLVQTGNQWSCFTLTTQFYAAHICFLMHFHSNVIYHVLLYTYTVRMQTRVPDNFHKHHHLMGPHNIQERRILVPIPQVRIPRHRINKEPGSRSHRKNKQIRTRTQISNSVALTKNTQKNVQGLSHVTVIKDTPMLASQ